MLKPKHTTRQLLQPFASMSIGKFMSLMKPIAKETGMKTGNIFNFRIMTRFLSSETIKTK